MISATSFSWQPATTGKAPWLRPRPGRQENDGSMGPRRVQAKAWEPVATSAVALAVDDARRDGETSTQPAVPRVWRPPAGRVLSLGFFRVRALGRDGFGARSGSGLLAEGAALGLGSGDRLRTGLNV